MRLVLIQRALAAPEDLHSRLVWQQDDSLHIIIFAYSTRKCSQGQCAVHSWWASSRVLIWPGQSECLLTFCLTVFEEVTATSFQFPGV